MKIPNHFRISIIPLLSRVGLHHEVVPFLPAKCYKLLEAPIPFVIGFPSPKYIFEEGKPLKVAVVSIYF